MYLTCVFSLLSFYILILYVNSEMLNTYRIEYYNFELKLYISIIITY